MATVHIPGTIEGAKARLSTAGWERAAIVWAHTRSSGGRPANETPADAGVSAAEMGRRLGVSEDTIGRARKAWKYAMEHYGAADVKPGDEIALPTADYPPTEPSGARDERGVKAAILNDPDLVQQAVETFPAIATAAVKGLAASPTVARAAMDEAGADAAAEIENTAAHSVRGTAPTATPAQPYAKRPYDFDKSIRDGFDYITGALTAIRQDGFQPDGNSQQCLALLRVALTEWWDTRPASVHDEIDAYLKQTSSQS